MLMFSDDLFENNYSFNTYFVETANLFSFIKLVIQKSFERYVLKYNFGVFLEQKMTEIISSTVFYVSIGHVFVLSSSEGARTLKFPIIAKSLLSRYSYLLNEKVSSDRPVFLVLMHTLSNISHRDQHVIKRDQALETLRYASLPLRRMVT